MNLNAKVNMFNTLYNNYLNSRKISLNMSWIKKEKNDLHKGSRTMQIIASQDTFNPCRGFAIKK